MPETTRLPATLAPPAREGPVATDAAVRFRLADPTPALGSVRLVQEVALPRSGPLLRREGDDWVVDFVRPPVDRMEYLFELTDRDGGSVLVPDPANPRQADGPFGPKSVVEFPGYLAPAWLAAVGGDDAAGRSARGTVRELAIDCPSLGGTIRALLWASAGTDPGDHLPLLVALDGVEYDVYSNLTLLLDWLAANRQAPPMRAALLHPLRRGETYSAAPEHAEAMAREILPYLELVAPAPPGPSGRAGMGTSLGALAMLHCQRTRPESFGGLFLQSGSFFRRRHDRYEVGFEWLDRIWEFVAEVGSVARWDAPVPVVMSCGTVELNLASNRAMALVLRRQGYPVRFCTFRDGHNWTAWRDDFHPGLAGLLSGLWR